MLQDLVTAPPPLSAAGGIRLANEVGGLVTMVASECAGPEPVSRRASDQLARVDAYITYIAEHLADPDVGPTPISRALNVDPPTEPPVRRER
jgi:hypothetical protein